MKEIWFSSKGFANIPEHKLIPDFTIKFENAEYQINSILADFISPKISRIHQSDPLCSTITIPISDSNHFFENIISSLYGSSLKIIDQAIYFYLYVFNFLENDDIVSSLENSSSLKLTNDNIISIIEEKIRTHFSIKSELSFLAENFFKITYAKLALLSSDILAKVFNNSNFVTESEDSVLHFVNRIVNDKGEDYKILYNYILYENLSNDEIYNFFNLFDTCDLSGQIWYSLCQRMSKCDNKTPNSRRYHHIQHNTTDQDEKEQEIVKTELSETKFRYYEGFIFNGILSYLTREVNRNIQDAGLITATSSSIYGDRTQFHPKMALTSSNSSYFMSKDIPNSWIMFDFKNMEIQVSHYVIRTYGDTSNSHLKSWVLEVSKDGQEWTVVDRRVTDYSLKEDWGTAAFKCFIKKRARYVRLTQTGRNHRDTNCLLICSIDFYGKLYK